MRALRRLRAALLFLLRKLMFVWVRTRVLPKPIEELELPTDQHVVYVLDIRGISNALVVEQVCEKMGLPRPLAAHQTPGALPTLVYLREMRGWVSRRIDPRLPAGLDRLIEHAESGSAPDVCVVPVSIFWGRSPDKEKSSLKVLFSDSWSVVGRFRKALTILLHGRPPLVQFSTPALLSQVMAEGATRDHAIRKLSPVLRVHLRRRPAATIVPDLSHRPHPWAACLATTARRT